jgi:co-chaperonin GroES (HSP10)
MKMLGNNVLVTEVQKEATTAGGIILTESIDKGSKPALVLSVGNGALGRVLTGNRVFLDWSKSMPVNVEGKAAAIIDCDHIKAVISEGN